MVEKIYFDMDGVLADFEKGLQELCDISIDPQNKQILNSDDEMWMKIKEVDHFYDKLDPLPDAKPPAQVNLARRPQISRKS